MDLEYIKNKSLEIAWAKPPRSVFAGELSSPHWFKGGYLNASVACLDSKIAKGLGGQIALYAENELGQTSKYTYQEILNCTCQIADELKKLKLTRDDTVALLLPQIPEAFFAALACARLAIPFSFIFTGFSQEAIVQRIRDLNAKVLITTTELYRSGAIPLASSLANIERDCPDLKKIFYFKRQQAAAKNKLFQRISLNKKTRIFTKPVSVESNHPLFYIFTSGTTGNPKFLTHSTGGFLVYAKATFDEILKPQDKIYFSSADLGWITGITYSLFAPLLSETPQLIYEGAISQDRYLAWPNLINKYKVGTFFSSPSAFRAIRSKTSKIPLLPSLERIATVGERLDDSTWNYIYRDFSRQQAQLTNVWFQSETGGIILYSRDNTKSSVGKPFAGIKLSIRNKKLYINESWPGQMISSTKNYFARTKKSYFSGDAAKKIDGNYFILGRADEVMNISGHRISAQDIEEAVRGLDFIAECLAKPTADPLVGQKAVIYVVLKEKLPGFENKIISQVHKSIGKFVLIAKVKCVKKIPSTFSGKLVRRAKFP